jgi:hypothetical protein
MVACQLLGTAANGIPAVAQEFAYEYGLRNFIWFSHVALLATLLAIWLRSPC